MKKTTLNGKDYDLVIDGSDIIAQGLTENIIFEGGYDKLEAEADSAYYHERTDVASFRRSEFSAFANYSKDVWMDQYIEENIEYWVVNNLKSGKIETLNLN